MLLDRDLYGAESAPEGSVEKARMRLREHAERTKQAELDEALTKLDAQGELTDAQRETLTRMATRITDRILAPPEATMNGTAEPEKYAKTVLRLFDPDERER